MELAEAAVHQMDAVEGVGINKDPVPRLQKPGFAAGLDKPPALGDGDDLDLLVPVPGNLLGDIQPDIHIVAGAGEQQRAVGIQLAEVLRQPQVADLAWDHSKPSLVVFVII